MTNLPKTTSLRSVCDLQNSFGNQTIIRNGVELNLRVSMTGRLVINGKEMCGYGTHDINELVDCYIKEELRESDHRNKRAKDYFAEAEAAVNATLAPFGITLFGTKHHELIVLAPNGVPVEFDSHITPRELLNDYNSESIKELVEQVIESGEYWEKQEAKGHLNDCRGYEGPNA